MWVILASTDNINKFGHFKYKTLNLYVLNDLAYSY